MNDHPFDLFISFAQENKAWVEGYLLDTLTAAGVRSHTEEAFTIGIPRLLEFERAVKQSARTLLVLSPAYLAEQFVQFVDLLAQSYGLETTTWPVIPLLLEPMELPTRLAMLTHLDATSPDKWETALRRLLGELQRTPSQELPRPPCPYPGMVPFSEDESENFFGRDKEITDMVQHLRLHPFLTIIGASGSGKSSLVFAGLQSALHKSDLFGKGDWIIQTMRPGATPLYTLDSMLPSPVGRGAGGEGERTLLIIDQFEETYTLAQDEALPFQETLATLINTPNLYIVLTVRADFYGYLLASPLWAQIRAHRLDVTPLDGNGLREAIIQPAQQSGVFIETALVERLLKDAEGEPGVLPLLQETLVLLWEHLQRRYLPLIAYENLATDPGQTVLKKAIANRADAALANLSPEEQAIAQRIFLRLVQFGEGREDTRRQQLVTALRSADDSPAAFEHTLQHLAKNRLITLTGDEAQDETRYVDISHEMLIVGWPSLQNWLAKRREAEQDRRRLEAKTDEWARMGQGKGGLLDELELLEAEKWLDSKVAQELGYSSAIKELVTQSREERNRNIRLRYISIGAIFLLIVGILSVIMIGQANLTKTQDSAQQTQQAQIMALGTAITNARAGELSAQALFQLSQGEDDLAMLLSIEAYSSTVSLQTRQALYTIWKYNPRLLQIMKGYEGVVWSVAFSPDGQTLATGSCGEFDENGSCITGEIWLWNVADVGSPTFGQPLSKPLTGHTENVMSVAFSPDGQTLATGSCGKLDENDYCITGEIRLWDVADVSSPTFGQSLGKPLTEHTDWVEIIVFSPDGRSLASGSFQEIRLWDVADVSSPTFGQSFGEMFIESTHVVMSMAFSPDGQTLASGSCGKYDENGCIGEIRLWNVADVGSPTFGQPLSKPLTGHTDWVMSLVFSSDGQTLASGSRDNTIRLWDIQTRQPIGEPLTGHTNVVMSLAFSPDGQTLASGSTDNTIRLWNVADISSPTFGQPFGALLTGHTDDVWSLAFNPDGQTLASGSFQEIRLWDVADVSAPTFGQPFGKPLTGHTDWIISMAFSPDGQTLASGSCGKYDENGYCIIGEIRLWDVADVSAPTFGQPIVEMLIEHANAVISIMFSPDGQTLASGSCGEVNENGYCINGEIRLWDVETGIQLGEPLTGHHAKITSMAFSPDRQTLASGSCGEVNENGYCINGEIRLWDVATSFPLGEPLTGHATDIWSMAFSPDGQILASGSCGEVNENGYCINGEIRLWDVETGTQLGEPLTGHRAKIMSVAFSPDGQTLASGSFDNTIRLWNMTNVGSSTFGQPFGEPLIGHTDWIYSVVFSPDGQTLASGSEDNTIRLWDVATGIPLGEPLTGDKGTVVSVAFNPNGQFLASGTISGKIRLWNVLIGWINTTCQRVGRNLTIKEWNQYLSWKGPYHKTCDNYPVHPSIYEYLINEAKTLAYNGNIDKAVEKLSEVLDIAPELGFDPEMYARQLGAQVFVEEGKDAGQSGDFDIAVENFIQALALNPTLDFDPETYAGQLVASSLIADGKKLATNGAIEEAVANYKKAQELDSGIEITANSWNFLCWWGSLWNHAKDVLFACEKAVELAPEDGNIRDSRGVARALTGDLEGAIKDFRFAIDSGVLRIPQRREDWITILEFGQNPITEEVLERLKYDP